MAKITIEVDSESKELKVTMDGESVDDVSNIYVSKYSEYFSVEIGKETKEDNGMLKTVRYTAYSSDKNWSEDDKTDLKALASVLLKREID